MEAPEYLLSWTDEEIEHAIRQHSPPSTVFDCVWSGGYWRACIESESGESVYVAEHVDRRMALYALYGQLWLKSHRSPSGTQWDPGALRPSVASVTRYVQENLPDPEDLDPSQVAAVYGLTSRSQKG